MKANKLKSILGVILCVTLSAAACLTNTNGMVVNAAQSTTYTKTINADGQYIKCQDGYQPEATYDRLGLMSPQDMVIDEVVENGKTIEYAYILNAGDSQVKPFITRVNLDNINDNPLKIDIGNTLPNMSNNASGLWIRTTTVRGVTRKEMYITDTSAKYYETIKANDIEKSLLLGDYVQEYTGIIYRVQFNDNNELQLDNYDIIHQPMQEVDRTYSSYELISVKDEKELDGYQVIATNSNFKDKNSDGSINRIVCRIGQVCDDPIAPLGVYKTKTPAFGEKTDFRPDKISVDSSGNIFVASTSTSSGMIQLTYTGEFVSFFVVNTVPYNFLYQFIKNYGTKEQLEKLTVATPPSFSNVFIDKDNLVYSISTGNSLVFNKYSTGGSSILETTVSLTQNDITDSYVTKDGLIFLAQKGGIIYVLTPGGKTIFFFGTNNTQTENSSNGVVGFFKEMSSIVVDSKNRIWATDSKENFLQSFVPTTYANNIFDAITSFNNHDYEASRKAWEEVLKNDSLSVLANDGLGKAYYYDLDFKNSLKYFSTSKNRALYSNVFWELRNDYLQSNLTAIILIAIGVICFIVLLKYLSNHIKKLYDFKQKLKKVKDTRVFKDLTVGFRMIKKPADTFYELKTKRRGSIIGATIHYILAIIAFLLNTYSYALPFQYITAVSLNPSTVLVAVIAVLAVFVLCNYLVSAINDGEGTFADIYKFTGYSLLPMIICLPLAVGLSYGLTLNEEVVISLLKVLGFWGSGILLVIGIIETHNYTFWQTVKNIILTIIFMVLFFIICVVVFVMLDQIKSFIETVWKEVKLRAGWY